MITLFTRAGCQPCATAKAWLDKRLIPYEEVDADRLDAQEILRKLNGGRVALPTFMSDGRILVGWPGGEDMQKWLEGLEDDG